MKINATETLPRENGGPGVSYRWAVSAAASDSRLGSVALVDLAPGAAYPVERFNDRERIVFVFAGSGRHDGDGDPIALREGDGVLVPATSWHGFENDGAEPVQLVCIYAPLTDPAAADREPYVAGATPGPPVVRVSASEVEYDPDLRDDMGFVGLSVKWLVNADTAGSERMLFGLSRFEPGGSHVLHKHPEVEEVIFVIEGEGRQLVDGDPLPVRPGDVTFAAADEWHGHLAAPDNAMRFMFIYLGKASLAEAGYDLHSDADVRPAV